MDKILIKSILDKIEQESIDLEKLKQMVTQSYSWTEPSAMNKTSIPIGSVGVYKIIHKEYGVMYIGQGRIANRKCRHTQVFKNKGKDLISKNGHVSPSAAGKKMYKFDKKLKNWLFSYIVLNNKKVATEYETQLTEIEEPEFNNLSMCGVG